MDYSAPYGSLDPDAPYRDRSTPDALRGSVPTAKAIENPQREIVEVILRAGLTPSHGDTTQLWQALQFFFSQFPIFPECLNSNGTFDVSSPSPGTIRVPAGIAWVMRGATRFDTDANVDLTTIANKTYHLRWDRIFGFRLRDLSDVSYNPTASPEGNAGFDSTYDDILVARVVTSGSNVATIANLVNRSKLITQTERRDVVFNNLNWSTLAGSGTTLNWARTPQVVYFAMNEWRSNNSGPDGAVTPPAAGNAKAVGGRVPASGRTRYALPALEYYYEDDTLTHGVASWTLLIQSL